MVRIITKALLVIIAASVIYATNLGARTPAPRATPVSVGEMAPEFTLEDHHGGKARLSEARGKSPVVLVFYRGYW